MGFWGGNGMKTIENAGTHPIPGHILGERAPKSLDLGQSVESAPPERFSDRLSLGTEPRPRHFMAVFARFRADLGVRQAFRASKRCVEPRNLRPCPTCRCLPRARQGGSPLWRRNVALAGGNECWQGVE